MAWFSTAIPRSLLIGVGLLLSGCGYSARPGLASHLKTVYVKPFTNQVDITKLTSGNERFPLYRPSMEVDLTRAVVDQYHFTGLLRPVQADRANCRLEGELIDFHRDPLRYTAAGDVEEWRLNIAVRLKFYDLTLNTLLWEEERLVGDTTYFTTGPNATSEAAALDRAITDLARRVVERSVENW